MYAALIKWDLSLQPQQMEMQGHLVCLNSCIRMSVCTCVVPMRFQSVMDCGQVEEHGTLTERERDADRRRERFPSQERQEKRDKADREKQS